MYPITQILRFSEKGPELASRFGPFMYLGIAFVTAVFVCKLLFVPDGNSFRFSRWMVSIVILVMFLGNFLVSFPRWALLPGPYMASADTRSVDGESMNVAVWARENLVSNPRLAADRINGLLLVAYAHAYQVTGSWNGINVPGIFLDVPFTEVEYRTLCEGNINFMVVDYRFTTHPPRLGFYFEMGENEDGYQGSLEAAVFDKFKDRDEFSLIYNDGTILIYQVDLNNCDSQIN